jgi:O-methyltransferase involved in polyketide biosynthesis
MKSNEDFLLGGDISMTAALVNESRARRPDLSKDVYARDWIPAAKRAALATLWNEYAKQVYPNDDVVVSVRNRFFLHLIDEHTDIGDICVIAACGLTSYPYLAKSKCHFVELDLANVIAYKNSRVKRLVQEKILPKRSVQRNAIDLSLPTSLSDQVKRFSRGGRTVVILEGISYYIRSHMWLDALQNLWRKLKPGDIVAFDFWPQSEAAKDVYKSYASFCRRHGAYDESGFNHLSPRQLTKIANGAEFDITSVSDCEQKIFQSSSLKGKQILRDTYAVFEL